MFLDNSNSQHLTCKNIYAIEIKLFTTYYSLFTSIAFDFTMLVHKSHSEIPKLRPLTILH